MEASSSLMTSGDIKRILIRFALPIFWGNLFQQLYNVVDALVVGNFVGNDALAAVTSVGALTFLLVGFFNGMFSGVGIVISRYFGAEDHAAVEKAVGTAVAFSLMLGAVFTLLGVAGTPFLLELMDTPPEVMGDAVDYTRIYFAGILAVVLYNTANGIFQAVGDSRHPLYYLMVSSLTNVALDLLFVAGLGWGVSGAALATVLSQAVSVVLAFGRLFRVKDVFRVRLSGVRIAPRLLAEMLRIGLPAGVQNSVIAMANVVVQSSINSFGSAAMAGCGAYAKIEGFVFIPITSFTMALTTFISQNLGAGERLRAQEGARFGILFSCLVAEGIGLVFFLCSPWLLGLFGGGAEAMAVGVARARVNALFYFLLSFSHCIAAILRGAGRSSTSMIIMLTCWCGVRVGYIAAVTRFVHRISVVFWAYPLTWFLSSLLFLAVYRRSHWWES